MQLKPLNYDPVIFKNDIQCFIDLFDTSEEHKCVIKTNNQFRDSWFIYVKTKTHSKFDDQIMR